ncbi:hypothetical protein RN001_012782 [Aquatica leii]|uniref:Centriolar and ciliogenesis-associated protein HYLS1 C-terminal domain-containing protein n=1 Tax=Aquatica leii TaxID=1421715 RepID=A0AAN7SPM6_9COLE|nr:hypothetical protein RN001_012782 [Aquatica leii]
MSFSINPRQVLSYLNELGYSNISREQLKDFMLDLKKLIKYEIRSESKNINTEHSSDTIPSIDIPMDTIPRHHSHTESSLLKQKQTKGRNVNVRIERLGRSCSCGSTKTSAEKESYQNLSLYSSAASDPVESVSQISASPKVNNNYSKRCSRTRLKKTTYILPRPPPKISKCDPVDLYHKYKEKWEKLNIPGEENHSELRWAIRERLIGQPQYICSYEKQVSG